MGCFSMVYYPECGALIGDNARFCENCGNKIDTPDNDKKGSKLRKVVIIVLTVAVFIFSLMINPFFTVIFLIVWIVYYANSQKKSSKSQCSECGAKIDNKATYCMECGESIDKTEKKHSKEVFDVLIKIVAVIFIILTIIIGAITLLILYSAYFSGA